MRDGGDEHGVDCAGIVADDVPVSRVRIAIERDAHLRAVAAAAVAADIDEIRRLRALADVGVTDFAASEFGGNPDEIARTREALRALL